jgi:hypothetical protein
VKTDGCKCANLGAIKEHWKEETCCDDPTMNDRGPFDYLSVDGVRSMGSPRETGAKRANQLRTISSTAAEDGKQTRDAWKNLGFCQSESLANLPGHTGQPGVKLKNANGKKPKPITETKRTPYQSR